jgi:conjugative transfer region protein TrbK
MGRAGGLVMGAIVLGLALALALIAALDPPAPGASAPQISRADAPPDYGDTLRRCRTVTEADPNCEAAWETKRRHFFRTEKSKP